MAFPSDREIKSALAGVWTSVSTTRSENVRVIPRWKLSLKGKEVMSALRDLAAASKINGVYITRVKRSKRKLGHNHWEYKDTYAMFYFRSYEDGNGTTNSEDAANAYVDAVGDAFEDFPGDGVLPEVDEHSEMQLDNFDTLDLKVHIAQCSITLTMTKQPD